MSTLASNPVHILSCAIGGEQVGASCHKQLHCPWTTTGVMNQQHACVNGTTNTHVYTWACRGVVNTLTCELVKIWPCYCTAGIYHWEVVNVQVILNTNTCFEAAPLDLLDCHLPVPFRPDPSGTRVLWAWLRLLLFSTKNMHRLIDCFTHTCTCLSSPRRLNRDHIVGNTSQEVVLWIESIWLWH